jgi:acetoin utilization deacetylase AcuC-like enzyme
MKKRVHKFTTQETTYTSKMYPRVYLLTDERMAFHRPLRPLEDDSDENNVCFENPNRIHRIYEQLLKLEDRLILQSPYYTAKQKFLPRHFIELPCVPAARETIELAHSSDHYDWMRRTSYMRDDELRALTVPDDLYFNRFTFLAACLAVGGVVESVNAVTNKNTITTRAIALVRPPGHHAEKNEAMGR